jgi:hypothetical protein
MDVITMPPRNGPSGLFDIHPDRALTEGAEMRIIGCEFYGDANKYMKIFEANKDKLTDPNKVNVGTELLIP